MLDEITMRWLVLVEKYGQLFAWVIIFSLIRFIMRPTTRTIGALLTSLFISVPVGMLVGSIMLEYGYGANITAGIASFAAVQADRIMSFLLNNQKQLGAYADRIITNLIDKFTK